jgi:predicted O-methyltransferase YrrM
MHLSHLLGSTGNRHLGSSASRTPRVRARWGAVAMSQLRLASKAVSHPERALLRLLLQGRLVMRNPRTDHQRFLAWLSREFDADAAALDAEYQESRFRRAYLARIGDLQQWAGPQRAGTSGSWSVRALYLLVRAIRPQTVVETGVLYGASSAHILAALTANGAGRLYSVDLPHEAGEPPVNYLVPDDIRDPWHLIQGDSRRELPRLLERLGKIDCFHHDSLHTFEHMTWEYRTVLPYLPPGGVLSSHDVLITHSLREIFRPNAFQVFCDQQNLRWTAYQNHGFAIVRATGS